MAEVELGMGAAEQRDRLNAIERTWVETDGAFQLCHAEVLSWHTFVRVGKRN